MTDALRMLGWLWVSYLISGGACALVLTAIYSVLALRFKWKDAAKVAVASLVLSFFVMWWVSLQPLPPGSVTP